VPAIDDDFPDPCCGSATNADPTLPSSGGAFLGPGGQDIVTAPDGHDRLVFHAWDEAKTYRAMHVIELDRQGTLPRAGKEAP
jgi:hypothetical protein